MIRKTIQAIRAVTIDTRIHVVSLEKDDIRVVQFENEKQFEALLVFDNFREVHGKHPHIGMEKPIPVIVDDLKQDDLKQDAAHICDICERAFPTKRGLTMHRRKAHADVANKAANITEDTTADGTRDIIAETIDADVAETIDADVAAAVTEKDCSECQTGKMIVVSEFNIPEEGIAKIWQCSLCGFEDKEVGVQESIAK